MIKYDYNISNCYKLSQFIAGCFRNFKGPFILGKKFVFTCSLKLYETNQTIIHENYFLPKESAS